MFKAKVAFEKVFPKDVGKNFLIAFIIFVVPVLILTIFSNKINAIMPPFGLREILTRVMASYFFARSDLPALIYEAFKTTFGKVFGKLKKLKKGAICILLCYLIIELTIWLASIGFLLYKKYFNG